MSIGVRVMFLDGDRIVRVSQRRFERVFDRDLNEAMPEYAGQRVRCAMVYMQLADRKPVEVVRIDYMVLPLDPEGRLDADLQSRKMMLAGETFGRGIAGTSEHVVDFGPYLAERQYHAEYKGHPRKTRSAPWWTWRLSTEYSSSCSPASKPRREKCLAVRVMNESSITRLLQRRR